MGENVASSHTADQDSAGEDHEAPSFKTSRDPTKCGVRKRSDGEPCGNVKGYKTTHVGIGPCKFHGGATRNHQRHAALVTAERLVVTYGLPVDTTPEQAIISEIQRTAGAVAWLEERVRELSPDELVWGRESAKRVEDADDLDGLKDSHAGHGHGDLYEVVMKAGASAWLTLYQKERKHLADLSIAAIRAGLEERRVRMAERQGLQLAAVVKRFVIEMGIPSDRLVDVPGALQRALDAVQGTAKIIEGSSSVTTP